MKKLAILIITFAAISCNKEKACSTVTEVFPAGIPYSPGVLKVVTAAGDTITTTSPYKLGQLICK